MNDQYTINSLTIVLDNYKLLNATYSSLIPNFTSVVVTALLVYIVVALLIRDFVFAFLLFLQKTTIFNQLLKIKLLIFVVGWGYRALLT